jgi:glycosidase
MRRACRAFAACLTLAACSRSSPPPNPPTDPDTPEWARGAVCYEVFVRSFSDSNGDGTGDLNGLTAKLDYINDGNPASRSDLGASCIWLMPVAQSPSYHGYDVSDYYTIERDYGTNDDFKRFMTEAHRRGIRVFVDMVLNHASSEHSSFQAALRDTTSPYRSWYRFSPQPLGKGPWGAEAWHRSPVRNEYYYGIFWKGMPDLNYDTPAVREEAKRIATFWLRDMGVDGFRLDAVQYLAEEGSCMSSCGGTHVFLREYAAHVRSVKPDAYTIGEVWARSDTLMMYYPDQLTSYFWFSTADSLLAAARRGSTHGLLADFSALEGRLPAYRWSTLLSNHDQTRVMTKLGGNKAQARAAATLLLTLPGLPYVYYGEEIGMTGDKPDERIRTPMQWSAEPGLGFTTGKPWQSAQPDSLKTTVEAQSADSGSLLNLYRRLIHLRKKNAALGAGRLIPVSSPDTSIATFIRRSNMGAVLVIVNLGTATINDVLVSSAAQALSPGGYALRDLLTDDAAEDLEIGSDGAIRDYHPLQRPLRGGEGLVLELLSR